MCFAWTRKELLAPDQPAPLINRKTRPTQNQVIASRLTFCFIVSSGCFFALFLAARLAFTFHRYGCRFDQLADCRALAHLKLHEVGRIIPRITGRTKVALGIVHPISATRPAKYNQANRRPESGEFLPANSKDAINSSRVGVSTP